MHYQWMMNGFEEILEDTYGTEINKKRFDEFINRANNDLENLLEGFGGMKDEEDVEVE
jgi:benzoyl-CoA reductase/2-hydroxyglutaryl-CoA dehydratase subunit BcrC/BadD/HgdB